MRYQSSYQVLDKILGIVRFAQPYPWRDVMITRMFDIVNRERNVE